MNLKEINTLIKRVENDKDLFNFYTKKIEQLIKMIFVNVSNELNK